MARSRILKPGFFTNETLAKLDFSTRLCYAGLWLLADREGRLEDRPERIKIEIFPFDQDISVDRVNDMLDQLGSKRFLVRYRVRERGGAVAYIWLPTFLRHQHPHPHEAVSRIPAPPTRTRTSRRRHGDVADMSALRHGDVLQRQDEPGLSESVSTSNSVSESTYYSVAHATPPHDENQPDEQLAVITKLTHQVLDAIGDGHDLTEAVKEACAYEHIAYNASVITKAIASARFQRRLTHSTKGSPL